MNQIDWHPSPRALRQWSLLMSGVLAAVGSLFYFLDWGIFAGGRSFGIFLWGFGVFCFLTGIGGTVLGLPAYWMWMGFVWLISRVLGYSALAMVFFFVVTPLALLARATGRDRLALGASAAEPSFWKKPSGAGTDRPERTF